MSYYGDIRLGDTVDIKFTTRRFSTGAPYTLASSPVISAYVGNGTTEITSGITLTVDFDSRTGLNNVRVVASSGNGFATATNVQLVITTGTVDSVSVVGEVVGSFSIENRSALMPATAGRTAVVDASGLIDANAVKVGPTGSGTAQTARDLGASVLLSSGTGTGQLDFTSGVVKANVTQYGGSAGTFASGRPEVNTTHIAGSAVSTTTAQIGVNVVQISADATAADNCEAFFDGTGYAGTNNVIPTVTTTTTATNVTTVNGLAAGVITAASIASDAITDAKVASDVTIASVTGAVGSVTGNVGGNVAGSVGSVTAAVTLPTIPTDWITAAGIAADAIGASELAASAVTEIQTGLSTLDAAGIRTAVGLASANLDTQIGTLATAANLATVAGYLDTEIAAILADTNELQTDWANGGRLDLLIDAIKAKTDLIVLNDIADAILKRDMSAVSGESARSMLNALRFLRNKWAVAAGTLTVKKEDDSTTAWTASVSTDAAADPIIGSDPA